MSGIHFKIDAETVKVLVEEWRNERARRHEIEKARYETLFNTLAPYAPLLFRYFSKDDVEPIEHDPLVEVFMRSITPEQISEIAKHLTTEQMVLMMQFVDKYIESSPKAPEEPPAAPPSDEGDKST